MAFMDDKIHLASASWHLVVKGCVVTFRWNLDLAEGSHLGFHLYTSPTKHSDEPKPHLIMSISELLSQHIEVHSGVTT